MKMKAVHFLSLLPVLCLVAAKVDTAFQYACDKGIADSLDGVANEIVGKSSTIDSGECVPMLGQELDAIVKNAIDNFDRSIPQDVVKSDAEAFRLYKSKLSFLEATLDAKLQLLFLKQITILRKKALENYKRTARSAEHTEFETMLAADTFFTKEAELSCRAGSSWDYTRERAFLRATMAAVARQNKKLSDVQLKAASQHAKSFRYLLRQQQELQAIQMSQMAGRGGGSPWSGMVSYKFGRTPINLVGVHQNGKSQVQMSFIPEGYERYLGPGGFTNGVGPGNLGMSFNCNL